jgi:methylphosphotriester-DNA--protein-cysteine methyltransferase
MIKHNEITNAALYRKIRRKEISFGGNMRLKIYGTLQCGSGKRIKKENRAFFASETEAIRKGYRPCGHCMKKEYKIWKNEPVL